jgi:LysM repeat protein
MRDVALTAAIFAGAVFMVPTGSSVPATSFSANDAPNIHTIIKQPTQLAAVAEAPEAKAAQTAQSPKQPAVATLAAAEVSAAPAPVMATVQMGDTLTSLASNHGTTSQRLFDANPAVEHPDLIHAGQQLRVPDAVEQLAARAMPAPAPVTQVQETAVAAAPAPAVSTAPAVADGSVWDRLAQCESGGNWAINTGNGFYGGLQFTLSSWQAVGGTGMPHEASREEQILRGEKLQAIQGWGAWPACTSKLGIR